MAMHVKGFLHKLLSSVMHQKRLVTLIMLTLTALKIKKISLTELGRSLDKSICDQSGIRRADRFIGNKKIEREAIYGTIVNRIIASDTKPNIIVDWSNVPNTTHNILRAALVAEGRALTLYEEAHPEKKLGNASVQKKFLRKIKELLPENCKPIIITDGGFHNEWFRNILKLGWDYLGRIRAGSGKKFSRITAEEWEECADLCKKATKVPKYVGEVYLGKKDPLKTSLYLYKGKSKKRKLLNRIGKKRKNSDSLEHAKSGKEPWILATSLSGASYFAAKRVVEKYRKRMQIEEGFRDLKSTQYGFGFEKAHSKDIHRIEILLLIAMLASFIAWLIGWTMEKAGLHYKFQSNSIKNRRVLSFFFLGCRAIDRGLNLTINMLEAAINDGILYAE
jgi:hypothetical protein